MEMDAQAQQEEMLRNAGDSYNAVRDLAKLDVEIMSLKRKGDLAFEHQVRSDQQKLRQRDLEAAQDLAFNQAKESLKPQPNGNRPA